MQRYEIRAWLGDTDATEEQVDALLAAEADIARIHPGDEDSDDRAAALTAAAQLILGDATPDELMAEATRLATVARAGRIAAQESARHLLRQGLSEVVVADRLGVTRMTVRSWAGK